MAEERRCQAQGLCANNCGFFGSPATQNLCSKCYRDLQLKEQQSTNAKFALDQTLAAAFASSSSVSSSSSSSLLSSPSLVSSPVVDTPQGSSNQETAAAVPAAATADVMVKQPNRCLTCRKRVGLMGFKCKCGMVFCGTHRYPVQHDCEFDFKSLGKEQIAKANPVIKAEKLNKI